MGAIAGMPSFFPVQLQKVIGVSGTQRICAMTGERLPGVLGVFHSPINGKRIRIGLFIAGMGSFGCTVLIHKSAQTLEKYM